MTVHLNAWDQAGPAQMVKILLDELVAPNPGLEIYIAHMGGSGAYTDRGREILRAFAAELGSNERLSNTNVYFELSAVVLAEPSEGVQPPTEADLNALAEDIRKVGVERIVFGSDHPSFSSEVYRKTLIDRLPLGEKELDKILGRKGLSMK